MNSLARIAYLVATDPAFRQALQADPEAAVASHGLSLDDETRAVLREMQTLLARPPATPSAGSTAPTGIWIGGCSFTHTAVS
jgi:hypothetical protein